MAENGKDKNLDQLSDDAKKYSEAWTKKMSEIWKTRIEKLEVFDTGYLRSHIGSDSPKFDQATIQFVFRFVQYGIYAEAGVGNGYKKGNGGDLKILDPVYRHEHGLDKKRSAGHDGKETSGKPRKRREWHSPSWYISQRVLADKLQKIMGDSFEHLFDDFTIGKG